MATYFFGMYTHTYVGTYVTYMLDWFISFSLNPKYVWLYNEFIIDYQPILITLIITLLILNA
jgi:hypothetical protein